MGKIRCLSLSPQVAVSALLPGVQAQQIGAQLRVTANSDSNNRPIQKVGRDAST